MCPVVGSISPAKIFKKVDFPAPLAPMRPYVFPSVKLILTSSNNFRSLKRSETSDTVSNDFLLFL